MTIELDCPSCGENRFRYPDKMEDDTPILCETCGRDIGTFGELKRRMADQVVKFRRRRMD